MVRLAYRCVLGGALKTSLEQPRCKPIRREPCRDDRTGHGLCRVGKVNDESVVSNARTIFSHSALWAKGTESISARHVANRSINSSSASSMTRYVGAPGVGVTAGTGATHRNLLQPSS